MKFTFEDLGWYFAWDKDGKYPVDVNNPIPVPPDGTIELYLTNRPIDNGDGTWTKWYVVEGCGERLNRYFFYFWSASWYGSDVYDPFTVRKSFIVAGDKKINKFNIETLTGFAIEELFYGYSDNEESLLTEWPDSGKSISDYANINNGVYVKFSDYKNKLGGSSQTGGAWLEFSEIPPFINGVNDEMSDLTNISANIQNIEYKRNQTVALLCKILKDKDEDVILFQNHMFKIYWNNEDSGIYIEIAPVVGEIKSFKLSSKPIEIGENIYITLIKSGGNYRVNCNGHYTGFTYNAVDYVEEYVQHDDSLVIEYLQKSVCYADSNITSAGRPTFNWRKTLPTFAPNKNRGSFIDAKYVSMLLNYDDIEQILTPKTISTTNVGDFLKTLHTALYTPQQIKISNITKPIYVSAILNPVRMTGVVKRTYYVENNEIKHRDEVYAV